jgi:uncharacterized protein (DUF924 family)
MSNESAQDIVNFWLGDSVKSPEHADQQHGLWYRGGERLDDEIRSRFEATVVQAREGSLRHWESSAEGALALVILLDQFTRNIFRGTPEAYSGDEPARGILTRTLDAGRDQSLPCTGQVFLYHPFHHSETLTVQNRGVALLEALAARCEPQWKEYVLRSVKGFSGHRDIVAQFGRFPHRNGTLKRPSTPEEQAFMKKGGESFGQNTKSRTSKIR